MTDEARLKWLHRLCRRIVEAMLAAQRGLSTARIGLREAGGNLLFRLRIRAREWVLGKLGHGAACIRIEGHDDGQCMRFSYAERKQMAELVLAALHLKTFPDPDRLRGGMDASTAELAALRAKLVRSLRPEFASSLDKEGRNVP